ncbi:nucleotidyl transferase AbiEii/AbiGii toxin family protein [Photorhabdus khanii]|uniref:Nucleotidyl transferase AbiEii/AbiGii toxin family protein n=2 Tax=Photorhabdus khanii TaxID=1004150 RepID=A0A4R4JTH7_9GAMM|nr:nucleotidyl transferase AbiEii/AbiGii toxin family protein [Photorhabdus khanii]ETS32044.1 protein of unknown function (DUF1814) [Photorhabdus khanii NC19]TDB57833.1 nucleotidyl transferase AbiEii/AbiGii toxin family protein [Photorhabdus khanii subsp. guanajuatensis]
MEKLDQLKKEFTEVAFALGINNPAIIEKDYWVVHLLTLIANAESDVFAIVFGGGSALAKSHVKIMRMSEDVDLKIIPYNDLDWQSISRSERKRIRKCFHEQLLSLIVADGAFSIASKVIKRDEYRYIEIEIKYPQQYQIAPCLRPIIKLELMETTLFEKPDSRSIASLVAEQYRRNSEVKKFLCVNIESTFVEKIVSMLRRTALVERNPEEWEDETLVRHIYDVHLIKSNYELDLGIVYSIFNRVIYEDVARYGNKQPEFTNNPFGEMRYALSLIKNHEKYAQRFELYVDPMVYNEQPHDFGTCFTTFEKVSTEILDKVSFNG